MFNHQGGQSADFTSGAAKRRLRRVTIYLSVIFIMVLFTTCELKTGISFDGHGPWFPNEGPERVHEPWTWKQVAGEMQTVLARRLFFVMLFVVGFEAGVQYGRLERKEDGTVP